MSIKSKLTIGKLAEATNINVETVRYYERLGLINQPESYKGHFRVYSSEDINKIRFIKQAKTLGFSLKEINELLSLSTHSKKQCLVVKEIAIEKVNQIDEKINHLREINKILVSLIADCEDGNLMKDCVILKAIKSKN